MVRSQLVTAVICATFAMASSASAQLALGDALAASADPSSLARAAIAYARVPVSDRDYLSALDRLAWTLFLLDRTPESIERYVALLDRLDATNSRGAIRDEALVMLAAMLADPDWDRDGRPDDATASTRLASPAIVAQDRPWLSELYFETARALHLCSRDTAAIALLDEALARWPPPAHGTALRAACDRHHARPTTLRDEDPRARIAADAVCAARAP